MWRVPAIALVAIGAAVATGEAGAGLTPVASGPVLVIKAPLDGEKFTGPLPIDVEATDLDGVGRISIYADGTRIRSYTPGIHNPKRFPKKLRADFTNPPWQGAKHLANGDHTIKIVAVDGALARTTRAITVRKVDPGLLTQISTEVEPIEIAGSGATRTFRTRVTAAGSSAAVGFRAVHHLRLYFEKRVHGGWRTAHKYSFPAKDPVRLTVTLEPAHWRVRAVFARKSPFLGSSSDWAYFDVA